MNERQYVIKQLQNELKYYERCLDLLNEIHLGQINDRANIIIKQLQHNKKLVEKMLKGVEV